jgi:predicted O-methyltransferase YrrM
MQVFTYADLPLLLQKMAEPKFVSASKNEPYKQSRLEEERKSNREGLFDQVTLEEALRLYSTVRELKPANTLEIGFCTGASGLAILKALEDNGLGTHYAVDPFQTSYAGNMGGKNVKKEKPDHRLRFFETFPERASSELPRVQFAFIDASHLFDLTLLDFVLVDKLLEPGGVLALHDAWLPAIKKVVRFALTNREYAPHSSTRVPRSNLQSELIGMLRELCRQVPDADGIFAQEFFKPVRKDGLENLIVLKKIGKDNRDWKTFRSFWDPGDVRTFGS